MTVVIDSLIADGRRPDPPTTKISSLPVSPELRLLRSPNVWHISMSSRVVMVKDKMSGAR